MTIASNVVTIIDCGGRRSGIDRRQFSYTDHLPARRSNKDRRKTLGRRSKIDHRSGLDRRTTEHGMTIKKIDGRKNKERRCFIERRSSFTTVSAAI